MTPRKTNAVRLLDRASISYKLAAYGLAPEDFSAEAVAEQLGLPADEVFKTLIATGAVLGPCFAVVPGSKALDLRALAIARGERKMSMVPVKEVAALTGYQRGAVTVLGARRPYPAVVDASAVQLTAMAVSAGARGLQMILNPADFLAITGALVTDIAR